MATKFRNRSEAGQILAKQLTTYANNKDVLVLALPRGGVPVAFEVAKALNVPLDICLVRKLGVPGHSELAMGAIASRGVLVLNHEVINWLGIDNQTIDKVGAEEWRELQRRDRVYRGDRPSPDIKDKIIILIDDGIATGSTIKAAIAVLRKQQPQRLVLAVPVASPEICQQLQREVDELVCLKMPEPLYAIGLWYEDFTQTTDAQVRDLLSMVSVA